VTVALIGTPTLVRKYRPHCARPVSSAGQMDPSASRRENEMAVFGIDKPESPIAIGGNRRQFAEQKLLPSRRINRRRSRGFPRDIEDWRTRFLRIVHPSLDQKAGKRRQVYVLSPNGLIFPSLARFDSQLRRELREATSRFRSNAR